MWITKKKLEKIEREQYVKAMREEMNSSEAIEQYNRVAKLEKDVKKIKKSLRKLEGMIKDGY
jgi:hypothetical protein